MRKLLVIFALSVCAFSQARIGPNPNRPERTGSSLPATCNLGDIFFLTTISGANAVGLYECTVLNTWTAGGPIVLADTPLTTRADLLTVNSTPALARLAAGGANTVLHGGTDLSYGAVNLAADVSGQLPISAVGSAGLSATAPATISTAGVIANGLANVTNDAQTKAAIVPNTVPTAGQILTGNVGNTAYAPVSLSGSGVTATLSAAGLLTLSAIANTALAVMSANTVKGNATGGSATPTDIATTGTFGSVVLSGGPTFTGQTQFADGTAALPAITFSGGTTGFHRLGGSLGIDGAGAGAEIFNYDAAGQVKLRSDGHIDFSSSTTLQASNTDTALCRGSAGVVNVGTASGDVGCNTSGTLQATNYKLSGTIQNVAATATMGITLKNGSGGGNYTASNTTYANVDTTNLCSVVTIPTGWKLGISIGGSITSSTAIATVSVSVSDIGTTCGAGGTTALKEVQVNPTVAGTAGSESWNLNWVISGDGAAHAVSLQAKTSAGADAWLILNSSSSLSPSMVLTLMPSN